MQWLAEDSGAKNASRERSFLPASPFIAFAAVPGQGGAPEFSAFFNARRAAAGGRPQRMELYGLPVPPLPA